MSKQAKKTSKVQPALSVFESTLQGVFEQHDVDTDVAMQQVKNETINKTSATAAGKLIKSNMQFVNSPFVLNDSFSLVITHGQNKWKNNEPYFTCNLIALRGKSKSKSLNSAQLRAFASELPVVNEVANRLDELQKSLRTVLKYDAKTQ